MAARWRPGLRARSAGAGKAGARKAGARKAGAGKAGAGKAGGRGRRLVAAGARSVVNGGRAVAARLALAVPRLPEGWSWRGRLALAALAALLLTLGGLALVGPDRVAEPKAAAVGFVPPVPPVPPAIPAPLAAGPVRAGSGGPGSGGPGLGGPGLGGPGSSGPGLGGTRPGGPSPHVAEAQRGRAAPVPDVAKPPLQVASLAVPADAGSALLLPPMPDGQGAAGFAGLPRPPAPDRLPAWRRNAVASRVPAGRPMVAVVIDDMGLDRRRSAAAAALPAPLTLSFLAYAEALEQQVARARASGHEILIHLPMQPEGPADPGPRALTIGLSEAELIARVRSAIDAVPFAVGVNNHMGSRFTSDAAGIGVVVRELASQGLLFLDSRTSGRSQGVVEARRAGLPPLARDVFLDDTDERAAIERQLAQLEREARRKGFAIGIGHPRDRTLAALGPWLASLGARGLVAVPLSRIAERMAEAEARASNAIVGEPR